MDLHIGLTQNGQKLSRTEKNMSRTLKNLCLVVKTVPKELKNMQKISKNSSGMSEYGLRFEELFKHKKYGMHDEKGFKKCTTKGFGKQGNPRPKVNVFTPTESVASRGKKLFLGGATFGLSKHAHAT